MEAAERAAGAGREATGGGGGRRRRSAAAVGLGLLAASKSFSMAVVASAQAASPAVLGDEGDGFRAGQVSSRTAAGGRGSGPIASSARSRTAARRLRSSRLASRLTKASSGSSSEASASVEGGSRVAWRRFAAANVARADRLTSSSLGRTRVIQRRFDVGGPRARVS